MGYILRSLKRKVIQVVQKIYIHSGTYIIRVLSDMLVFKMINAFLDVFLLQNENEEAGENAEMV